MRVDVCHTEWGVASRGGGGCEYTPQKTNVADTTVRDFFQLAAVFAVDPDTGEQAPFAWGLDGIYTAVEVRPRSRGKPTHKSADGWAMLHT